MGNDINNEDEIHTFDLIIQETGGFGRFQQMILVLSLISSVVAACNHLSPIYLTYTPCFDCIDNLDLNGSDFPRQENYQCPSSQDVQICNQWKYDSSIFESTVVTEFDLVCNRAQLLPTIASSYMSGIVVTIILMGIFSDHYGRKKIIVLMSLIHITASFLTSFSNSFSMFVGIRFFVGGSIHAVWSAYF